MRKIIICCILCLVVGLVFISCSSTADFYESFYSDEVLSTIEKEAFLQEGEEPIIFYSTDIVSDSNQLRSNYFTLLGSSSFNGAAMDIEGFEEELRDIAIEKGAKVVLYDRIYTNTIHSLYTTSYGIYSSNTKRYDYDVYYFISTPTDYILLNFLGFTVTDLNQNQKTTYMRNTGAIINTVWNKSPAYYANLVPQDIVVGINGIEILDSDSYYNALSQIDTPQVTIEFIRNGILSSTVIDLEDYLSKL